MKVTNKWEKIMKIKIRCKVAFEYEQEIEIEEEEIKYLEEVNNQGYFDHPRANDLILQQLEEQHILGYGEIQYFESDDIRVS